MEERVLVAGATGALGRAAVAELVARGYRVRALVRDPERVRGLGARELARGDLRDPASLASACAGVNAVLSCAGASMRLGSVRDRRSFAEVDHLGNRALLRAAEAAGVRRFVYVSLHGAETVAGTAYADAHERMVGELRWSRLESGVVRPTGFFSFLGELVPLAARGRGIVIGDGTARTNPIHEADVATACADAVAGGDAEIAAGGPDVFTRRELVELAFRAVGREPRVTHVAPAVFRVVAALTRPLNPRLAGLVEFGAAISQVDCIAPVRGTRRLEDYFREVATRLPR